MRSAPRLVRHLRLASDTTARPGAPTITTTITPLDAAALASDQDGVRWVLIDDTDQPAGVASTADDVLDFATTMLSLGVNFAVEPIRDRCRTCGAHPTDHHTGVCAEGN